MAHPPPARKNGPYAYVVVVVVHFSTVVDIGVAMLKLLGAGKIIIQCEMSSHFTG